MNNSKEKQHYINKHNVVNLRSRDHEVTHSILGNIMLVFDDEDHVKTRQDSGHEVNVLQQEGENVDTINISLEYSCKAKQPDMLSKKQQQKNMLSKKTTTTKPT